MHRFDPISFVFGLVFVVAGMVFALTPEPWRFLFVDLNWGWLGPLVLIGLGVVVMLPLLRRKPAHPGEPPTGEEPLGDAAMASARKELPPDPLP
jgi:uncharacterized protein YjeT (DUF2065 family)